MFYEYALIPDIFNHNNYSAANVFEHCLNPLKEALLDHAIVRDLNNGAWSDYVRQNMGQWHPKANELLKKLKSQNRFRLFDHSSGKSQTCDTDWCAEAEFSHGFENLNGIIISNKNISFANNNLPYSDIEHLSKALFWKNRECSQRVRKDISDYLSASGILLACSNSLMFIDPHLDPSKDSYSRFQEFFNFIAKRKNRPQIEVHRVGWYTKDNHGALVWEANKKWEETFRRKWGSILNSLNMKVWIYIWDDFHDRYLISDIGGISVPYGFDTANNRNVITTWTRLGRRDREHVAREFDSSNNLTHNLRHHFVVG